MSSVESRDAYLGALRHLRERTDWSVVIFGVLMTPLHNLVDVSDLRRGQIDGALVSGRQIDIVDRCQKQGIPVVGMNRYPDDIPIPTVSHDDRAIGRLGARHFLRRGIRSLGFCGPDYASVRKEVNCPANTPSTASWTMLRLQGFEDEARSAQAAMSVFCDRQAALREGESDVASMRRYWSGLREWIRQLPRPVGILAGTDRWAINCLTACRAEGLDVPRDVSVLGVDNDVFRCEESRPALSSIDRNMHQVGWTAADVLVRFLQTGEWCDTPILVPPAGIVERHSTQALAVANAKLARALEFVRSHFCDAISLRDVARAAGASESWLRRGFRHELHFSLVSEIRRLRVEKACELLSATDLPLKTVAQAVGFGSEAYFGHVFAKETGVTPGSWRSTAPRALSHGAA